MTTWIQLWILLPLPTLVGGLIAGLPMMAFNGKHLGGGAFREWLVNHVLLPLCPNDVALRIVDWFAQASALQEWLLAFVIVINLNALLLPAMFVMGEMLIGVSGWLARKDLSLKRKAARG